MGKALVGLWGTKFPEAEAFWPLGPVLQVAQVAQW